MEYTFEGIKTEMKTQLSLLSEWKTTIYFGVYERIIDLVAYIINKFVYIAEYFYREANWKTAQNRESLVTMTDLLSYKPYRKVGAIGTIQVIGDPFWEMYGVYTHTGLTITIPRWAEFESSEEDTNVYCTESTNYSTSQESYILVSVREGYPKEYVYVATGIANEIITIFSDSIDNEEIEVFIVDSNSTILSTVNICDTGNNPDEIYFVNDLVNYYCGISTAYNFQSVNIQFGDGISSRKLGVGERVLIKYAETNGVNGNIQSSGVIDTIKTTLYDAVGLEATLYCVNTEGITDGSDIESIESIRQNGRYLFYAGYRCGGHADWLAIIQGAPYVHLASIWSVEDLGGSTVIAEQQNIYITAISSDGSDLTLPQKADLENSYLRNAKSPTERISWQTLQKIYIKAEVIAKIQNETISVVDQLVKDTMENNFGILNTQFQINAYESNVYNILDDIEQVIYHTTILSYMEWNMTSSLSNHTILVSYTNNETSNLEEQVYLKVDSVELWVLLKIGGVWNTTPIKIANSSGTTISGTPGYTVTGTISYITNTISYTASDFLLGTYGIQNPDSSQDDGYLLELVYNTINGNSEQGNSIRLPYFFQVTDIHQNFILTNLSYQ